MEALSRETLETMIAQAVAHAATVSVWPMGEAPGAKNSDAVFTPEPRHTGTSHYDRAVTGIRAPEITVYAPQNRMVREYLSPPAALIDASCWTKKAARWRPFLMPAVIPCLS